MAGGVALLIFAVFVAYAFLTRATYRTTALVEVEPLGAAQISPPAPLEAARRLREVVLARDVLEHLATEAASGTDGRMAAASRIRDALQIDTIDSRVFSISYKDSEPERARTLCNRLARQAAERAPRALMPARSADERQQESERDQRAAEVIAFLSAHPEVALQAQPASSGAAPKEDAALTALHTERARLAQRLEALSLASDNPYAEPADTTLPPEQIKRRIAEIDGVVASRRRAIEQPGARAAGNSAFDEQWRKTLQGLAELPVAIPQPTATESFKGRVASEAPLPSSPLEPNRPLVLFIGFLVAMGCAGLIIIARSAGHRRGASSRPRSRSERSSTERPPEVRHVSVAPVARSPSTPPPALPPSTPPPALPPSTPPHALYEPPPMAPQAEPAALPDPHGNGAGSPETAGAYAFAATMQATPMAGTVEAAPQKTNSILPHAVIEVNAPERRPRDASVPPADGARRPSKRAATRVTQVLGSPIVPVPPRDGLGSEPPPAFTEPSPAPPTQRGLPIPEPVPARPAPPPQGSDPQSSRPVYASEVVGQSPTGRRSEPPGTALARVDAAPQVLTYDISHGWQPEPSLQPGLRHGLRDELASHYQGRCFVVGVSAGSDLSEQKSRLSVELALSLSQRERTRVLLLEADFQRPSVHRLAQAKVPFAAGFSQQLYQRANSALTGPSQWTVARCLARLDVLAESALRAPGQMASPQFKLCVSELRRFYDFIVIDGPPLSMPEECRLLDRQVDGMVFFSSGSDDPAMPHVTELFSGKVFSKVVKRA
jgi:Mrp family chromosome partitioning ATPase